MIKVVTWNVNSIAVRLERLLSLLKRENPDIVLLQELKCLEEKFPFEALRDVGYHSSVAGQKTYNGVAILSKTPPENLSKGLQAFYDDSAARLISVDLGCARAVCCYVPNGQEVGSDKYRYKLDWLLGFKKLLADQLKNPKPLIVGGDFNIAPEDRDVHNPALWKDKILCSEQERSLFSEILALGLVDTFRLHHKDSGIFSWWDYRALGFQKNEGLRIDFILASTPLARICQAAHIDRDERKGERPSDHAPVIAEFNLPL